MKRLLQIKETNVCLRKGIAADKEQGEAFVAIALRQITAYMYRLAIQNRI